MRRFLLAGLLVLLGVVAVSVGDARSFTDASIGYVHAMPAGVTGETWDDPAPDGGVAVADGGTSTAVDTGAGVSCVVTGSASGTTTVTLQVSPDGSTWYDTASTATTSGAADFVISATIAARYARLKSSATVASINARISCK